MDIDLILNVFRKGKAEEQSGNLKEAKTLYLDAATYAVQLAKVSFGEEQTRLENIARMLIDHAKVIKQRLDQTKTGASYGANSLAHEEEPSGEDFPLPPSETNEEETDHVTLVENNDKGYLKQILLLTNGGSPIFSFDYTSDDSSQQGFNEILFSGAITAVLSIMKETLHNSVRGIELDGEKLYVKEGEELIFVGISQKSIQNFDERVSAFLQEFQNIHHDGLEQAKKTGQLIEPDEKTIKILEALNGIN